MRSRPRCRAWRSAPAPRSTTSRWCREGAGTPVLSLMPAPGDVDIVLAAELMEAGRAMQRGLVTPDRTTLIASTHRTLAVSEKVVPGSGITDPAPVLDAARKSSKRFLGCDLDRLAVENGSVISASLFGALAGAEVLPFAREDFEATIEAGGRGRRGEPQGFPRRLRGGAAARGGGRAWARTPRRRRLAQGTSATVTGPERGDRGPGRALIEQRRARLSRGAARRCCSPASRRSSTSRTSRYGRDYLDRLKPLHEPRPRCTAGRHAVSASPSRRRNTSPTPWPTTT